MKRESIVVTGALLLETALIVVAISQMGFTLNALQTVALNSARISIAVFSIIFLFRYRPANLDRRLLGKPYHVFAVVHLSCLMLTIPYYYGASTTPGTLRLAGEVAGGLFTLAMPITVRLANKGRIGVPTLKNIELVFQYFIWLIFFMGFYARVNGTSPQPGTTYIESVILLGWMSLMLGMKVTSLIRLAPFTSRR